MHFEYAHEDPRSELLRLYGLSGQISQISFGSTSAPMSKGGASYSMEATTRMLSLIATGQRPVILPRSTGADAGAGAGPTAPAPGSSTVGTHVADPRPCECLFSRSSEFQQVLEAAGTVGSPARSQNQAALMSLCLADPPGFFDAVAAQFAAAGQSSRFLANCRNGWRPWYMRPTTWAIGGAAALGVAGLAWVVLR